MNKYSAFYLIALTLSTAINAQQSFTFCYDPYPPYTLGQTGQPTGGLKVELLNAIFREIDEASAEIVLLPWKRCQEHAREGIVDGILPLFKNEERAEYLVFADSTFEQTSSFWYKRSRFPDGISWSTYEDIKHLKLAMLNGGFIDKEMETTFENELGIHRGKDVPNLFELLLKERVDLVAIDHGVGHYVRKQYGWETELEETDKQIGLKKSYLGVSKTSSALKYMDQINDAIAKLKADGTIESIQNSSDLD